MGSQTTLIFLKRRVCAGDRLNKRRLTSMGSKDRMAQRSQAEVASESQAPAAHSCREHSLEQVLMITSVIEPGLRRPAHEW